MVNEMLRKIPDRLQETPEFNIFSQWVKRRKLTTPTQVKKEVNNMIEKYQEWIDNHKKSSTLGTKNTALRQHAKRLDFYKVCRDKFCKYI